MIIAFMGSTSVSGALHDPVQFYQDWINFNPDTSLAYIKEVKSPVFSGMIKKSSQVSLEELATLIKELAENNERFTQFKEYSSLWGFLFNIKRTNIETLKKHCSDLENALSFGGKSDINGQELCSEIQHLVKMLPDKVSSPLETLQFLHDGDIQDVFPNTWVGLRLLLTLPVTVASGERSFSKLKLIKTYLRSTMREVIPK